MVSLRCRRVRRLRVLLFDANVGYLSCIFEWFSVPKGAAFGPEMDRQIVFVLVVYRIHAMLDFEHLLQGFEGFTSSWQCRNSVKVSHTSRLIHLWFRRCLW